MEFNGLGSQPSSACSEFGNSVLLSSVNAEMRQRLEEVADDAQFDSEWTALHDCCPGDLGLWRLKVQRLIKRKEFEEALAMIAAHNWCGATEDDLLCKAELLYDAGASDQATAIFLDLVDRYPDRKDFRAEYAKRLLSDGFLVRAYNLLLPVKDNFSDGTKGQGLVERTFALFHLLTELEASPLPEDQDARILAMKHAILSFRGRNSRMRTGKGVGKLSLITGSLGPGGAERQLTRLSIELERARLAGAVLGGVSLDKPVEIIVRSHGPERQNDFYLSDVVSAGTEITQLNLITPLATRELEVEDEPLATLIDFLPPNVNYGVRRLTAHLRKSGTETASIWQDGACLFGGLASLMAGVPHIQLAIRGLPPSMRRHMYRPEYEILYRAMAEVPGVTFLSNNQSAAQAYADWLDIPIDRFTIVYNGVERMHPVPSSQCEECWTKFIDETSDATQTIGGVFRFDTDKQPLLWIRFARRYLKRHPDSRFVLVGGGRLLPNAEQLAEEFGIKDRILFVGRSMHVGYWMSKMDVLVLLSRYEGLPNVLIEAQYMGVRVVTTPAGGASECLIDGVTGHVLECAEKPDLERVVDRVRNLVEVNDDGAMFAEGGLGRHFLDTHFSIPRMLEDFVTSIAMRGICELKEPSDQRQAA